ncbi:MAG: YesL family protein [Lachnospiraceae bacterium]
MLQGLFNYDNPVWRFIGKLGDLIVLNILWIVTSIPIVTAGASTTALYYVTLKLVRDEDGYTIKSFFKSFKENFRQSTIIWLIMLTVGLILGFDLYFFMYMQTEPSKLRTVMVTIFGSISLIYICILTYVFPLQSRFYNPIKRTLFNAFFMSVRHILQTLGILVMDAAVVVLMFLTFFAAPQFSVLFFLFGFPLIAFVNSFVFHGIFKKYMPKSDREDDRELRPLFAEEPEEKKTT